MLAQLSPEHGWQIKYSLDFPGAPGGTIEYIVTHALKKIANEGKWDSGSFINDDKLGLTQNMSIFWLNIL